MSNVTVRMDSHTLLNISVQIICLIASPFGHIRFQTRETLKVTFKVTVSNLAVRLDCPYIGLQIIYAILHVAFYLFPVPDVIKDSCQTPQLLKWPCRTSFLTHVGPYICLPVRVQQQCIIGCFLLNMAFKYQLEESLHMTHMTIYALTLLPSGPQALKMKYPWILNFQGSLKLNLMAQLESVLPNLFMRPPAQQYNSTGWSVSFAWCRSWN